jgi:hypothetical protein
MNDLRSSAGARQLSRFVLKWPPRARGVDVGAKGGVAPNSEPTYRQLRDGGAMETYTVSNLTLKRDAGTIVLRSGRVSFLPPVMERVVRAVFVGDGQFTLAPAMALERDYLRRITESESVDEAFDKAVFCFTDATFEEIKRQAQSGGGELRARDVLSDFQKRVRFRPNARGVSSVPACVGRATSMPRSSRCLQSKRPGFLALICLYKFNDLRFFVGPARCHGAGAGRGSVDQPGSAARGRHIVSRAP